MRLDAHVEMPEGLNPFETYTTRPARSKVRALIMLLKALMGPGLLNRASSRPTLTAGLVRASAIITPAAVQAADTVTLNGQALTATQHNATGTVTAATAIAGNTVTINGVVFTGAAGAVVLGAATFSIDTGNNETAASLAAQINAYVPLQGTVTAVAASAVVTLRAVTGGTAGNAITLASSGSTLAVSAATLTNGAAVANNQFDFVGTNAQTATALAAAISASSTAIITGLLNASSYAATVALSGVTAGQYVEIGGIRFTAISGTATAILPEEFTIGGNDTADGLSLETQVNAHPALKDKIVALNATGIVTLRQLAPNPTAPATLVKSGAGLTISGSALAPTSGCFITAIQKGKTGNQATVATSNGTRLPITGSASRLAGGTASALTF